jgi:uncharacterized protein YraI
MKRVLSAMLAWLFFLVPLTAAAADGYTTANLNLRAGPDPQYPAVMMLPIGTPVSIQGCLDQWSWCDVIVGPNRGWVAGQYLQYVYQGQRVYVPDYGPRIGIPIVTFSLGLYWDSYYRSRPWYGQRSTWINRRIVARPPPPRPARPPSSRPPVNQQRPTRPPATRPASRPNPPGGGNTARPSSRPNPDANPSHPTPAQRPQPNNRRSNDKEGGRG